MHSWISKDMHTNRSLSMCPECIQKHVTAFAADYNRKTQSPAKPPSLGQRLRKLFLVR